MKSKKRPLSDLSEREHAVLKARGMLWEFYPGASGDWDTDRQPPEPTKQRGESVMNLSDETAQSEMPKYQSHKVVHALYIAGVEIHEDRSATIAPKDKGYAPFRTRAGWADRCEATEEDPGVYVVYPDGFTSWSPTAAFEAGYSQI